ncbi:hypothetical protein JCM3775_002463 [Rhodotorula graminis]
MSARTASRPLSTHSSLSSNTSPRKASRAPPPVTFDDDAADSNNTLLDSAHLDAILADFDLEATSYLRKLAKAHDDRVNALRRSLHDSLAALDHQVRTLSLDRFVSDFAADPHRAITGLVGEQMRPVPMSQVEQSVRKRKRVQPASPRTNADDDDVDVFFSTSKKARSGTSTSAAPSGMLFSSAAKGKGKAAGSVSRSASTRSKRNGMSPTSNRKPRLRLRPSTTASVYRNNPHLPPTPGPSSASFPGAATAAGVAPTTARRPKRGESIVMRSMNGSPLGEFIASEDEGGDDDDESQSSEDDDEDEGEGASDEDEWDLLERNEASKVEHQSASKGKKAKTKTKTQAKASSSSSSSKTQPPTSSSFIVALPAGAPSFNEVKRLWVEQMQANLRKLDVGEAEKRRLEEALLASVPAL